MNPSALKAFADLLLTRDERRGPLLLWAISTATYALYALLVCLQVAFGYTSVLAATVTIGLVTVLSISFYVGARKGWGPRRDPRLGMAQLIAGIGFMWLGYAISGPASSCTLVIVATHVVYAVFGLTPRRVWQLVAGSLVGLGTTMLLCHWLQPERFVPGVQVLGFLYTALVLVLIARLAALVAKTNVRMRTQREQLAEALERVSQLATRDDLTQVHNRRHLLELMSAERARHARSGEAACVALVDIDFFKVINDTHGHQVGDQVLQRFAATAQAQMRSGDLLGRWGGEEFLVMYPDTPAAQAEIALQRIRDALERQDMGDLATGLGITFSAGLVELEPTESLQHAIERADQAMYLAKQSGRDRTQLAPAMPSALRRA